MIKIQKVRGMTDWYRFTLVLGDTGTFAVAPYTRVDDEKTAYEMQDGDEIRMCIAESPTSEPFLTLTADEDMHINIDKETSAQLPVGTYYADITLFTADGNVDTFIPIPRSGSNAISNFKVVYGV